MQIAWRRAHTTSIIGKIRTTNNLPCAEVPKLSPGQAYEVAVAAVTDAGACRVPRSGAMSVPPCEPSSPRVLTSLLLTLASPCVCVCSDRVGPSRRVLGTDVDTVLAFQADVTTDIGVVHGPCLMIPCLSIPSTCSIRSWTSGCA